MSNLGAIIFAIMAGLSTTLEAFFNGELEKNTTALIATFISLIVGALFFLIGILVAGDFKDLIKVGPIKPVLLLGGVFGGLIIYFTVKAIPALGVSKTLTLIVVSQIFLGFIIDSFILGKNTTHLYNYIGAALVFIGVFFMLN
ncbi:EamA family transporter [Romboutsia sp. CE17]|uniref:DMT family transporter n=1 Tax=Romboutsia sp. CE17 TaxID=2724150 RepID=UPI001442A6F8|nr:DMT family transporter [Romboutsia sp. CE17]QJA08909.1 EamA family transporter [Romboutsia sp. CE17]